MAHTTILLILQYCDACTTKSQQDSSSYDFTKSFDDLFIYSKSICCVSQPPLTLHGPQQTHGWFPLLLGGWGQGRLTNTADLHQLIIPPLFKPAVASSAGLSWSVTAGKLHKQADRSCCYKHRAYYWSPVLWMLNQSKEVGIVLDSLYLARIALILKQNCDPTFIS